MNIPQSKSNGLVARPALENNPPEYPTLFEYKRPMVGLSVFIVKPNGKFLVGQRKGNHGNGLWSLPGGHLELMESWEDCVYREAKEECGSEMQIRIRHFREGKPEFFVTNNTYKDIGRHYITIWMVANYIKGEVINAEPSKCMGWEWKTFGEMKEIVSESGPNQEAYKDWMPLEIIEGYRFDIGI